MEIVKYGEIDKTPICICLGYFDAIHIGHTKIINTAKEIASKIKGLKVYLLVFTGGKGNTPDIFTLEERFIKLKSLGVDGIIYQQLTPAFMAKSKDEFLNDIFAFYNIKGVVVGEDFTYGKKAEGNVSHLREYCINKNANLTVLEKVVDNNGNKVSSSDIKNHIKNGEMQLANALIGSNYFIRGEVFRGKGLGAKIGFPTANIKAGDNKLLVKDGVYLTCTVIGEKLYPCLTNVGAQPTVEGKDTVIETYIDGFNGDLYGKTISVYFIEKIRDVVKFDSVGRLKEQLTKDLRWLK